MSKASFVSCLSLLIVACNDESQPLVSETLTPTHQVKSSLQFEVIRDRIVLEQCEKLQDPKAFQPSELVWD